MSYLDFWKLKNQMEKYCMHNKLSLISCFSFFFLVRLHLFSFSFSSLYYFSSFLLHLLWIIRKKKKKNKWQAARRNQRVPCWRCTVAQGHLASCLSRVPWVAMKTLLAWILTCTKTGVGKTNLQLQASIKLFKWWSYRFFLDKDAYSLSFHWPKKKMSCCIEL